MSLIAFLSILVPSEEFKSKMDGKMQFWTVSVRLVRESWISRVRIDSADHMWAGPARSAPISKMFSRLGKFCIWMYTGGIRSVYGLYAILPAQGASGDDSQPSVARSAPTGGRERPLGSPQAIRATASHRSLPGAPRGEHPKFFQNFVFFKILYFQPGVLPASWEHPGGLRRPAGGRRRPRSCHIDVQ